MHGSHTRLSIVPRMAPNIIHTDGMPLLAQWELWMTAAGMSPKTIEHRLDIVGLLGRREQCDPATATWEILASFLGKCTSAGTRQTYQANLRVWYRWLVTVAEFRADNPVDKLHRARTPRRVPHPCSTEELGILLTSGIYARTRKMVKLGAYQGLRAHEIARFRGDHIDTRRGTVAVLGKGGVSCVLPLHPEVLAEAKTSPLVDYWFPSPYDRDRPIRAESVSNLLSKAMSRAGVPGSAHTLRHWYGTHALRASGGNLRVAQELLRHANLATSAVYTEVDDTERRAALLALPGWREAAA